MALVATATIDPTKTVDGSAAVASTLTNFPVYLDLASMPAGFWSTVANGGGDIRIFRGATELAREVVSCDTATDTGEVWVKVDSVSHTVDTVLSIYADGSSSEPAATATYGSEAVWSDYEFVWHGEDGTKDSTGNYTLTAIGSPGSSTGQVGGAGSGLSASDHYVTNTGFTYVQGMTLQGWNKKATDDNGGTRIIGIGDSNATTTGRQAHIAHEDGGYQLDVGNKELLAAAASVDVWALLHGVIRGDTDRELYANGVSVGTQTTSAGTGVVNNADRLSIGASADFSAFGQESSTDEARLRKSVLSADWIESEYKNQAFNSDYLTYAAVAGDTTAPVLSSPTGTKTGDTTATGGVSTDEGNGTLYSVVTTSATSPSVAQIQAGNDHTGASAAFSGSQSVSGTGAQSVSATGLTGSTTYYFHFQHADTSGNDSTVASSTSFTTDAPSDVTAPTLTSPSGTETSDTAADLSVSTDEGNGTLYWVVTPSATSPSVAQVQAGQDHTGTTAADSGSQSVSGTGTQSAAASGLTASTAYYAHFQHQDAATNDSTVSTSASFTTDATPATTSLLAFDFDSASGSGSVTSATTTTPTISLAGNGNTLALFARVTNVNGKTPSFVIDFNTLNYQGDLPETNDWGMVWRYVDDATVPSDGRPRDWTLFDNNSGDPSHTVSMNAAFNQNVVEIAFKPRFRYLDFQRLFSYIDSHSLSYELPSSIAAAGLPTNVHNQVQCDTASRIENSTSVSTVLNQYCIGLNDTSVSPAGSLNKLDMTVLLGQHSSEDQGDHAGAELLLFYLDGTGTVADWFRQHVNIRAYLVNPLGRYHGQQRNVAETSSEDDPNRCWGTSAVQSSEQVDAVQDAALLDFSSMDVMWDYHGSFRLNGNDNTQTYGLFATEDGNTDFRNRVAALISPETIRDLGGEPITTGTSRDWAVNVWSVQFDATMEFGYGSPGFPGMESQFSSVAEDYIGAVELMVDNAELVLSSNDVTVDVTTKAFTLTENAASIAFDRNIAATTASFTLTPLAAAITNPVDVIDVNVSANTATLSLTTQQAVVALDRNVAVGTQSLTLTPQPASVALGINVQVGTEALALATLPASIGFDKNISVQSVNFTLETNRAVIAGGVQRQVIAINGMLIRQA